MFVCMCVLYVVLIKNNAASNYLIIICYYLRVWWLYSAPATLMNNISLGRLISMALRKELKTYKYAIIASNRSSL